MARRSRTLVHAVLMLLLMTLLPGAAFSQNQNPSEEPRQNKSPEAQTQQKPSDSILPEKGGAASEPETAGTAKSPEVAGSYIIKHGDTLWDISNSLLKDPFLWPFIWKANPSITNPDLIYPGNKLTIPSLTPIEQAIQAPAATEQEEQLKAEEPGEKRKELGTAPGKAGEEGALTTSKLILPQETPVPIIDKYSMLSAGYVGDDKSKDVIVGGPEGKHYFGYDDTVYVNILSKDDVNIGDKFIMFNALHEVKHPITGRKYGRLINILGILEITAKGSPGKYTARITTSFDVCEKGTMLKPYQEPTLVYNTPQTKDKDISGYILDVMEGRTLSGQVDIIYLDKGRSDGVEAGDRFLVYAKPAMKGYPQQLLGETQVIIVKEHTSTAIIRRSANYMQIGNQVIYKK
jgi:hypothetical protein